MANEKDHYETLGVSKNASPDEIKRAYRRLARQYHPDVNKERGAEAHFKEITEAYSVLSDPKKKNQYDTYGKAGPEFGGFEGYDMGDVFGRGFGEATEFGDLFDVFFGRERHGAERRGPERGDDIRYDLTIKLETAASGGEKEIELVHLVTCPICRGSGAKPGSSPTRCSTCKGSGQVSRAQRTFLGNFMQVTTCPTCRGAGEVISSPCSNCNGNGRAKGKHKISVKIPQGIDNGYKLRIAQAGNAGMRGGPPGDLYVFIRVEPHALFEREGDDLKYKATVSFVKATLGDIIDIPTLEGKVELKIPTGTQPNTTFRLKGKGMPRLQARAKGDLFVVIEVETPLNLTKEQNELLKKFGVSRGEIKGEEPPSPGQASFWTRI